MRRIGLGCVGALLVLGAAGCGGGHAKNAYTLSATQTCLKKAGFGPTAVANPYLPGSAGNLRVQLTNSSNTLLAPSNLSGGGSTDEYVFLVFDKTATEALATQEKAVTLAVQSTEHQAVLMTRAAARAGVGLTKNVFYYSDAGALTKGERTKITSCLR
jgi:hypothetical protein